jgi:type IV secretory pathway TrbL component
VQWEEKGGKRAKKKGVLHDMAAASARTVTCGTCGVQGHNACGHDSYLRAVVRQDAERPSGWHARQSEEAQAVEWARDAVRHQEAQASAAPEAQAAERTCNSDIKFICFITCSSSTKGPIPKHHIRAHQLVI